MAGERGDGVFERADGMEQRSMPLSFMYSIIFRMDLKVSLRMGADGADLRGGSSHHDMPAVPALPDLF